MRQRGGGLLAWPGRLRTVLTVAGGLLVTAGTQVIPSFPLPPVTVNTIAASLPGLPFETRIEANLERAAAAVTNAAPEYAGVYRQIVAESRQPGMTVRAVPVPVMRVPLPRAGSCLLNSCLLLLLLRQDPRMHGRVRGRALRAGTPRQARSDVELEHAGWKSHQLS